jgi:hypothetical protein
VAGAPDVRAACSHGGFDRARHAAALFSLNDVARGSGFR